MPILFFVGASFTKSLYESTPAGNSIVEDLTSRPALTLSMLAGMISGVLAFILGSISIKKSKERAALVYITTIIGALLTLFLIAEILFPH